VKPTRVMARPWALMNTSGTLASQRTANQARTTSDVCLQGGRARCRRPLPWIWIAGVGRQLHALRFWRELGGSCGGTLRVELEWYPGAP
jgi:hypothetical protein